MATVTKKIIPPVKEVTTFSIELTEEEAQALRRLLLSGVGDGTVTILGLRSLFSELYDKVSSDNVHLFRSTAVLAEPR